MLRYCTVNCLLSVLSFRSVFRSASLTWVLFFRPGRQWSSRKLAPSGFPQTKTISSHCQDFYQIAERLKQSTLQLTFLSHTAFSMSVMTSELEAMLVREFCSRAACGRDKTAEISSTGSLETETIQKFLSICLKQYFICSQDDTNESIPCPEVLKVRKIPLTPFCFISRSYRKRPLSEANESYVRSCISTSCSCTCFYIGSCKVT